MKRIAAFAAAALVVAGCGPAPAPLTSVTVYWEFDRNTFIDGVVGFVPYDVNVNWPPGTGNRACPQSGVDVVDVTDLNGTLLASGVPCVNQAVQGAVVGGFPGNNTYVVTGWRRGLSVPLYRGQVTVTVGNGVLNCGTFDCGTAIAAGIPDDLTIDMVLADPSNPLGWSTCGGAQVDQFQGWIEDGLGTLVWRNSVSCGPAFSPSIQYGPVDRDTLSIWIDTYDGRFNPPAIPWSKCAFQFQHLAPNTFFLNMDFGPPCTPEPPP